MNKKTAWLEASVREKPRMVLVEVAANDDEEYMGEEAYGRLQKQFPDSEDINVYDEVDTALRLSRAQRGWDLVPMERAV